MRKITSYSLITAVFLSLIFPNLSVFSVAASKGKETQNQNQNPPRQAIINLVSLPAVAQIAVRNYSGRTELSAICSGTVAQSGDILQDTGKINLNLPASCYSLTASRKILQPANLLLQSLSLPTASIKVIYHGPVIAAPDLSQAPVKSQSPVLPAVPFALFVSLVLALRKNILKRALSAAFTLKQTLKLEQLMVLRC